MYVVKADATIACGSWLHVLHIVRELAPCPTVAFPFCEVETHAQLVFLWLPFFAVGAGGSLLPSHLPRQRKVTFGCGSPARSFRFTVSSDVHEPSLPRALGTATTSVRRMRRFVHDGPLRLVSSILPRPFELVRTRPNRCRSTLHAASPHVSSFGEVLSARARPSPLILSRFVGVLSTRFRPRAPVQHAPLPSRPARPTSSLLPAAAEHASTPLRSHVACFGPSDRRSSCHVRAKTGVRRSRKTASPARNVQVRSKAAVCDVKRVKRDVEALESVAKCAL